MQSGADRPAIEVSDLVFEYPSVRALHEVSLRVAPNTITALVGPNGAGKTTLLRCIAGLEAPYSGWVAVEGLKVQDAPRRVHKLIGYLPDFYGLYEDLTVEQCLFFAARSHGISIPNAPEAVKSAARQVGLADRLATRAGELSRGLRQRLAIGQALVHAPQVLILDEPAAGLDPQARRDLSALLLAIKAQGVTQIVSSHILAELEDYCDQMIIIDNGRVRGGRAIDVRERAELIRVRIDLAKPDAGFEAALGKHSEIAVVRAAPNAAVISMSEAPEARARLLKDLVEGGFAIAAFVPQTRWLEEAYFEEVGEAEQQPAGQGRRAP